MAAPKKSTNKKPSTLMAAKAYPLFVNRVGTPSLSTWKRDSDYYQELVKTICRVHLVAKNFPNVAGDLTDEHLDEINALFDHLLNFGITVKEERRLVRFGQHINNGNRDGYIKTAPEHWRGFGNEEDFVCLSTFLHPCTHAFSQQWENQVQNYVFGTGKEIGKNTVPFIGKVDMRNANHKYGGYTQNGPWWMDVGIMDGLINWCWSAARPGPNPQIKEIRFAVFKEIGTFIGTRGLSMLIAPDYLCHVLRRDVSVKCQNYNRLGADDPDNTDGDRCFLREHAHLLKGLCALGGLNYGQLNMHCEPVLFYPGLIQGQSQLAYNLVYMTTIAGVHQQWIAKYASLLGMFVIYFHLCTYFFFVYRRKSGDCLIFEV